MTRVAYADGFGSARVAPDDPSDEVVLGWTPEPVGWLSSVTGRTFMAGYALTDAVHEGRLRYVPARLSAVPRLLADLAPDVAVIPGVRRRGELAYGRSVGWGPAAARAADRVVVEIDEGGLDLGGPLIDGNVVASVARAVAGGPPLMPRPPTDIDFAIARRVVSLVPDEPTLQFGPGGLAEAILATIDHPVRIWSGLVTDALADLAARGLLLDTAVAGYVWGTDRLAPLAADGRLSLRPVEETHDISALSRIDRFVGCNTALQVGLDGSVNVERINGRYIAGIGGHADFCAGASRSPGGLAIVALASSTRSGGSTIVPHVECVSTPRADVEVVVTEHGVADLRGVDDRERAQRIAAVAAPEHRARLTAAAGALSDSERSQPQEGPHD